MTKHFWCEDCDERFESEEEHPACTVCKSRFLVRQTMSEEEAEKLGLK